jgi:hypothetical protein
MNTIKPATENNTIHDPGHLEKKSNMEITFNNKNQETVLKQTLDTISRVWTNDNNVNIHKSCTIRQIHHIFTY